ncbi:hypothetical protein LRP50_18825 [Enterovibrio sp. ZSDZ42]|uniref:Uncharacterized protein n=1 Tax=Enterovibrio gelatinilyticus TaxID=2899819 RepID=A0ABT5R4I0_9GAMM|nr:hypothetical protein [Enterovibrio sp. ZSDZ42]MDD1795186.1 hypothetical protein [Enterovibrio sp. ZSDZ42]
MDTKTENSTNNVLTNTFRNPRIALAGALCLGLSACYTNLAPLTNSDVDFSNCREIAGGIVAAKADLQAQVPEGVAVNSLTDMGFVFDGSDDVGMLIVRSLACEAIQVTDAKDTVSTDDNVAFVHVGTPINVANLPATTYSNDSVNGADFNIYTLSYQTSSPAYFGAMKRAGLQNIALNEGIVNVLTDNDPNTCSTANLKVHVPGDSDYALGITGDVVEATAECHVGGADFIANWWSVDGSNRATALSNEVIDQTFTDTAGPDVFVVTNEGTTINKLIGSDRSAFTGFSGSGYLPSEGLGNIDMVAETLGALN